MKLSAPRVMRMRRAEKSRVYFRLLVVFVVVVVVFARALKQLSLRAPTPPLTTTLDFQKTKKCGEREKKEKTQNLKQTHQHLDLRDVNRAHRYISLFLFLFYACFLSG
jgi:hypothetical protein